MKLGFVQCDPTYPQTGERQRQICPSTPQSFIPAFSHSCPEELNHALAISLPNTTLTSGDEDTRIDISTMLALTVKAELEG
jgi:hypothetical protein